MKAVGDNLNLTAEITNNRIISLFRAGVNKIEFVSFRRKN